VRILLSFHYSGVGEFYKDLWGGVNFKNSPFLRKTC